MTKIKIFLGGGWISESRSRGQHTLMYMFQGEKEIDKLLRGIRPYIQLKNNQVDLLAEVVKVLIVDQKFTDAAIVQVAALGDRIAALHNPGHSHRRRWTQEEVERMLGESAQNSM